MKHISIFLFLGLSILLMVPAFAQGAPPATPIDGGLSALLVAGGAYGLRKIYKHRKS
ncbi:PID-CTERM protein-sorting domain-containing protein [Marinoscillum sp.]|uniref:PID-CTERM protein-sorting domain-containing protein n=1 Tax=Marinoscillum sp. TaxID=2024838 RepID=UPI003BAAAB10